MLTSPTLTLPPLAVRHGIRAKRGTSSIAQGFRRKASLREAAVDRSVIAAFYFTGVELSPVLTMNVKICVPCGFRISHVGETDVELYLEVVARRRFRPRSEKARSSGLIRVRTRRSAAHL